MKIAVVALAAVLVVTACWEPASEPQPRWSTEQVCDDGAVAYEVSVDPRATSIGPAGNDVAFADDAVFVVESAANTVSRFDVFDDSFEAGFLDVKNDRNPYAIAVDESADEIWIANYLSDTVTIADLSTGAIIDEIGSDGFDSPSSVALTDSFAYVANVAYRSAAEGYGPGSITVIDRQSQTVSSTFETIFENPHFLSTEVIDGQQTLLVSGAGALDMAQESVTVSSDGGLEWYDIGVDPVDPLVESFSLSQKDEETIGAAGRPILVEERDRLYFVSAIAPVLFVFDLQERRWVYDAISPLILYETDGDATHRAAFGDDGLLWITAFNEDQLYLFDTACDELVAPPIDLGGVADMLEGPQAVTVVDRGDHVEGHYLLSIANYMGRVTLR